MLFKSTMHRSSGEAYKCSKCKYLRPTPVQRNLNLEPEPKNLGGAGRKGVVHGDFGCTTRLWNHHASDL